MEGAYKIKTGVLETFSEQQLLDCTSGNYGCNGGFMENCYSYLKVRRSMRARDYPYLGYKSTCKYNMDKGVFTYIKGYVNVARNDPAAHMRALAERPLVAAVDAS